MSHQQLYLVEDGFLYYGAHKESDYHHHYTLQLSIGIEELVVIKSPDKFIKAEGVYTPSKVIHRLSSAAPAFVLFLFPTSLLANYCQQHFSSDSIQELPDDLCKGLLSIGKHIQKQTRTTREILEAYSQWRKKYLVPHSEVTTRDVDINYLLDWTAAIAKQPVPQKEAAGRIHSPISHFLDLFRKEVGIPYNKFLEMDRIASTYEQQGKIKEKELVTWAKAAGFRDSRRLKLAIRELFGWPIELLLEENYHNYQAYKRR